MPAALPCPARRSWRTGAGHSRAEQIRAGEASVTTSQNTQAAPPLRNECLYDVGCFDDNSEFFLLDYLLSRCTWLRIVGEPLSPGERAGWGPAPGSSPGRLEWARVGMGLGVGVLGRERGAAHLALFVTQPEKQDGAACRSAYGLRRPSLSFIKYKARARAARSCSLTAHGRAPCQNQTNKACNGCMPRRC